MLAIPAGLLIDLKLNWYSENSHLTPLSKAGSARLLMGPSPNRALMTPGLASQVPRTAGMSDCVISEVLFQPGLSGAPLGSRTR